MINVYGPLRKAPKYLKDFIGNCISYTDFHTDIYKY